MRKTGLPPVADEQTEILILGTLPSDKSLATGQYYANPANDLWKLISAAIGENFAPLTYAKRIELLKAHRIGLWDAFHTCIRLGSMDADIFEQELNDFTALKKIAPKLRVVCFNGQGAAAATSALRALGYETHVLPSSSSANRKNEQERKERWKAALS